MYGSWDTQKRPPVEKVLAPGSLIVLDSHGASTFVEQEGQIDVRQRQPQ